MNREEKFHSRYVKDEVTGCWNWTGARSLRGYGIFSWSDKEKMQAHEFGLFLKLGHFAPDGHEVDHLCLNKGCVNPDHLEFVTHSENMRRAKERIVGGRRKQAASVTVCPKGHPYLGSNLRITKNGARSCVTCLRQQALAYYYRNREKRISDLKARRLRKRAAEVV